MLREKIYNVNVEDREMLEEAENITDGILNVDLDEDAEEIICYKYTNKSKETINDKPVNQEDMNMPNGNGMVQAQQNNNPETTLQEDANMANGNELNGNGMALAQQNSNPTNNRQEDANMANGNEQNGNGTAHAQQNNNPANGSQEDANMANSNEQNGNGTAQAQQNSNPATNPQEDVHIPYTAEQEERIAYYASKFSNNPIADFMVKINTLRDDINAGASRKTTKKKLNLNDRV